MHPDLLANLAGPDILIVVAAVALLFGASQLPKLARSLGSASHEFRKGVEEGTAADSKTAGGSETKPETKQETTDPSSKDTSTQQEKPSS